MNFLKSYWWVFALIIIAFLLYWFVFRTPAKSSTTTTTLPPKLNPNCPLSVQQWLDLVAQTEASIDSTPSWKASVTSQVGTASGQFATYEIARKANAIWFLENGQGNNNPVCNPTKAPSA